MTTYVKVSELPASSTLADADVFIYNDDTTTSKITFSNLKTSLRSYVLGEANTFTGVTTFNGNVTFGNTVTISGLDKADVGLTNVDNTTDAGKPISTATQTALDLKANAADAVLTGAPTAPTAAEGTDTTQIATTAYVLAEIARDNLTDLSSPAFTGTPTAPTASAGTDTTQIATTAFVNAAITSNDATNDTLDAVVGRGATTDTDISVGDLFTVRGDGSSQDGRIKLNCSQNSHGVSIQAPPHSANATYTLVLPTTDGNAGERLITDGSGVLSWEAPPTPTTFELSGTTLRNVTGGHLIGLRNAANATTISLDSETGAVDFAGNTVAPEFHARGTGHLVLRAATGNDFKVHLAGDETLQVTRHTGTGNTVMVAGGGTKDFTFNSPIDATAGFEISGTAVTATAAELNYVDGVTSNVQTQLDAKAALDDPTFTTKISSPEFHSAGSHLKFKAATNDIIFYPNNTETLQITRSGTDCRFTSNGGTGTFKFNQDVTQRPGSSVTPSANGDLSVEATSNTTLTFKFKGDDGVVRSGTITLS